MGERPDFIVHNEGDNVGVVVVEDATGGRELVGWVMETDRTIRLKVLADVPLGHKLAMRAIPNGETIIKYDHDIGRATQDIPAGGYVHAHNIKTKRW
jgi:(2R)-sulfolactate sulfo-lyase subunit alpha